MTTGTLALLTFLAALATALATGLGGMPFLHTEMGPDVLPDRPVNGDVAPHRLGKFVGDGLEGRLSEDLHRAVVRLQSVVEGQLVFSEAELLSPRVRLTHLLGQGNEFLDDLGGFDRAILIASDRLLQHLGKRSRMNHIPAGRGS